MLPLEGLIDVNEEKNRLNKELANINLEIDIINKRLNNPMFIEKAPSNVINEVKTKQSIYTQRKFEIEKAIPEVVHRYFAGFLGLLIIGIFIMSLYLKPYNSLVTKLTGALVVLVLCQSTFGYLTVSLKMWPQVVTMHLF